MTQEGILETIRKTSLFRNIGGNDLADMASCVHEKRLDKGQTLFSMGDRADYLYIVRRGWVKIYRTNKEGAEAIINIFGPGESFAEAAVFSEQKIYPANAMAVEDAILYEVPRTCFVRKIEQDQNFALRILGAIATRQHFLVHQLEQFTTRTATQRIGTFLLRFALPEGDKWVVELPYDKSLVSNRLNIKPETFSRVLSKLEPLGVTIEKKRVVINDKMTLMEYCDIPVQERIF